MKILFDLCALHPSPGIRFHGGAEYLKTVLEHVTMRRQDETLVFMRRANENLAPEILGHIGHESKVVTLGSPRDLEKILKEIQPDIFYTTEIHAYRNIDLGSVKIVSTIHGIRTLDVPHDRAEILADSSMRGYLRYFWKLLTSHFRLSSLLRTYAGLFERIDVLVVSSNHTRRLLFSRFPVLERKTLVLYPPLKRNIHVSTDEQMETLNQIGLFPKSYFLIVSANRWVKNAHRALRALDRIYSKFPDIGQKTLVLGARSGQKSFRKLVNRRHFVFLDYVSDKDLETFYENAFAFIYPSLSEGFGYPPLESMRYGIPLACSTASSIPEVCGEAALYFNPRSVAEMQAQLLHLTFDENVRANLSARARDRYKELERLQRSDTDRLCSIILGRT